jgi:ATP-dependent DNA helicase RecG
LNRFGGDIFLGVMDDGEVSGVPSKTAASLVRNFIGTVSNPDIISPTVYLTPEIFEYERKTVIHIHIPPSPEVHTCKKIVFDRTGDADVKVRSTDRIAEMYIRKHDIYTERRIFKYVTGNDLRLDLLPRLRQMAVNRIFDHPWQSLSDAELLIIGTNI